MNRLVITNVTIHQQNYRILALFDEQKKPLEILPEPACQQSILGNIYIGRVENIIANLNSAFIRISPAQQCYLSLDDLLCPVFIKKQSTRKTLSIGDELLVQIKREALKTKEPAVTANLSLTGKYIVLTTGIRTRSVSKKLSKEQKAHYQQLLADIPCEYGIVVRTNAAQAKDHIVLSELQMLSEQLTSMIHAASCSSMPKLVYTEPASYIHYLKGLPEEQLEEIVTDDRSIFEDIVRSFGFTEEALTPQGKREAALERITTEHGTCIRHYTDQTFSLSSLYSLKRHIEDALARKVWLKSGGYLVIEPTEALFVIDVNTGKSIDKKSRRENFLRVNKEAAVEIARQLRLRNLSGMILVDFISMERREDEEELINLLRQKLKQDPVPTQFVDITQLGLAEITRKKTRKSMYEFFDFFSCVNSRN